MVKYDEVDGDRNDVISKLVKKSTKSWKTSKAWKVANVISFEESSFLISNTKLAFTKRYLQ